MGTPTKRCTNCRTEKPTADFYARRGRSMARCKRCVLDSNAARPRSRTGPRSVYLQTFAYKKQHPERHRAWRAVKRAVQRGLLAKPERCACGRATRVIAHHDDYAQPLTVRWVCGLCHSARHAELRQAVAA